MSEIKRAGELGQRYLGPFVTSNGRGDSELCITKANGLPRSNLHYCCVSRLLKRFNFLREIFARHVLGLLLTLLRAFILNCARISETE